MSVEASAWAWKVKGISLAQKLVLLCLADHSDNEGVSWPTQKTLSRKTGVGRQAVNTAIQNFRKRGILTTSPLGNTYPMNQIFKYTLSLNSALGDTLVASNDDPLSPDTTTPRRLTRHRTVSRTVTEKPNKGLSLPEWVDKEAWDGFVESRKKLHKPLTDYAATLIIKNLTVLKKNGQDPKAVLEQSIERGWLGVFPIKSDGPSKGPGPELPVW